jgi:predicted S18 family serine protease
MKTNDDSIKWVVGRLQALNQEYEEARRADRVVDHAACRIASETCLQELLRAYDRLDEAQAEVERLKAELLTAHRTWAERCSAWSDSVEEAEAQRDAAYRAGQESMRERCAALCDDWEEATYCAGWREMEQGAQHCAEAIRAMEVE